MELKEFIENIKIELGKIFPTKEITIQKNLKNNSVEYEGIVVGNKNAVMYPVIYLNDYYKDYISGREMNEILQDICSIINKNQHPDIDYRLIQDVPRMKQKICCKLINFEKNKLLLETAPHIRYLDLAIVFYSLMGVREEDSATVLINNDLAEWLEMDANALYELAIENTKRLQPYWFQDIVSVVTESESEGISLSDRQVYASTCGALFYVLSNKEKNFGAAYILYLDILENIAEFLGGCDFYILPSSVHEVIILPSFLGESDGLKDMVKDVNRDVVLAEEVLSDNVYCFSYKKREISMLEAV